MLAIQAGLLIDGTGREPLSSATLLLEEGVITDLGPKTQIQVPEGAELIDASEKTVLPGLFDCHCHPGIFTIDYGARLFTHHTTWAFKTAEMLKRMLHAGFTTVREAGALNDAGFKAAIEEGLIEGPRLLVAFALDQTGGHFEEVYPWRDVELSFMGAMICDGVPEVTKAARTVLRRGADFIKVATTGGVVSPNDRPEHTSFTREELEAIVYEASAREKAVLAHAEGAEGIKNAVRAGVWDIQHGSYLDEEGIDLMLERGTFLTPTLSVIEIMKERSGDLGLPAVAIEKLKQVSEVHMQSFEKAAAAGLRITCGTDIISEAEHGENALELELLVRHGLTPMQAIVAATKTSAEACRVDEITGTLEPGKLADLLVVDGNPLEDISILRDKRRILLVMKEGRVCVDRSPNPAS